MKTVPLTLSGVMCEPHGDSLTISRLVIEPEQLIVMTAATSKPMEKAAALAKDAWTSCFWYPSGEKEDKKAFMTWVVHVREDLVDYVLSACQPRVLEPEGDDVKAREERLALAELYRK